MSISATNSLDLARQSFFQSGEAPRGMIDMPILRSWQRCMERGLDVGRFPTLEPMTARELREIADAHERLRHIARPELEALAQEVGTNGSVVILSDPDGTVLDTLGSADFASRAAQVALRRGVRWSEDVTGTNAIGTALFEKRPVEVRGGEHYFERHAILTCAAAPIFDPQGRVVGALDISGSSQVDHRYALGLVRLAIAQIEHRFFDDGFADAQIVRFHKEADLLGTPREGIFVFREGRLVAANRQGLELMQLDWSALDTRRTEELFMHLPATFGTVERARGHDGHGMFARLSRQARRSPAAVKPASAQRGYEPAPWFDETRAAMQTRAIRLIDANIPLLITGETGTGKEVFARRVHQLCQRAGGAFVPVNCAALPESLIESELFGYAEGAFTGARKQGSKGMIREADKGILFLDEIGDMPLALQARLLRVLQDKQVRPLGGGSPMTVDFALICATHRDLAAGVAAGRFRQDLYYRLAQYPFVMPPLRAAADRRSLIADILERYMPGVEVSPDAMDLLVAYDWPGNFRELVGTLRVLSALVDDGGRVTVDLLPLPIRTHNPGQTGSESPSSSDRLEDIEREAMRRALDLHGGNVSRAARALGINRSTLYRRLRIS